MAGWWESLRRWFALRQTARTGVPPAVPIEPGNGVSSFHLWWQGVDGGPPLVEVAATLEVMRAPTARRLYFWALQASFLSAGGSHGAAHLGLQWNPRHPGSTAVNWGGYADVNNVQSILSGSVSLLASTPDDPNTRDYPWREGVPYRLQIQRVSGGWRGSVTDQSTGLTTVVRDLRAPGDRLGGFVVWSEVFAACTDPQTVVRWSGFEAVESGGRRLRPASVRVTFPTGGDCPNTDVMIGEGGLMQITNTERTTRDAAVLPVPDAR